MSLDLNNLKDQIQGIFETANTTTAARDLSSGLLKRVQKVLKVNPARIPIQASIYPCVTVFIGKKDIEQKSIGKSQANVKREGRIEVTVVGAVMNTTITSIDEDQADEDCESLMENIEEILRANETLAGTVTWSFPKGVTYHNLAIGMKDEEVHLRAGLLTLEAKVFY
jgi:hypothetical protein